MSSAVALSNAPLSIDNNLTGKVSESGRRHLLRHFEIISQDFQVGALLGVAQHAQEHNVLRSKCFSGIKKNRTLLPIMMQA